MGTNFDLAGKVVAITGGARGIGAATARAFVRRGAAVGIGDLNADLCRHTAQEVGAGTVGLHLDAARPDSITTFLDRVEHQHGPIDVMVNNAGIMPIVAFHEESAASIERQLDINVGGVIHGSQQAIRRMTARSAPGHIVNVASAAGKLAFPGVATYTSTKFAVVGLTAALAEEYHRHDITFSAVMPAIVRTDLAAGLNNHPLLRSSTSEQVAEAIVTATIKRKFDVPVPAEMALYFRLAPLPPHRITSSVLRLLGADRHLAAAAHNPERTAYEQRAANTADTHPGGDR